MKEQEQEQKELTLEAQLLINKFYELETNGEKMDYDTAVECAKITSKFIFENGSILPEERLYWRCLLKQCDLLHSKEYLMAILKRDEKIYSHADESGSQGTQGVVGISDEGLKGICIDEVRDISADNRKCQSSPTKMGWYLCRLEDGDLKLCYWRGAYWENVYQIKIGNGIVRKWMDLPTHPLFASALPI